MKERKEIKPQYKWDLTHIFKNDEEFEKTLKDVKKDIEQLEGFKGKLGDKKSLLKYFELSEKSSVVMEALGGYAYLKHSEDLADGKYTNYLSDVSNVENMASVKLSFVEPELMSLPEEYLKELLEDKNFEIHHLAIADLIRNRKHVLNESEEIIMSKAGNFADDFSEVFDNIDALDVKFEGVKTKNRVLELDNSNYRLYMESKKRELRKQAFKNLHGGYMALANTIATNYIASVKSDDFFSNVYRYDSTLNMSLNGNNIPEKLYYNLIENVEKNIKLLHKYYNIKKRVLGLPTMEYYDTYVSLSYYSRKYTYEEGKKILLEALKPLGEDYIELLKQAFSSGWIDVYPNKGKATGAYCLGVHSAHPYVMLNTVDNLDSVFTLAHELGHAMHSYYSSTNLPYTQSHYPIFLAEIASTTNEVLLLKYFYKNATKKQEKVYFLDKYLSMFKSTLFRQTMFSEFEDFAHKQIENKISLNKDILTAYYGELNKKYHGKAVNHCKEIEYEWLRIPHFYNSYYVFKYATGITSAIVLASNILSGKEGALEKYKEFLSSGGKDYPTEILKKAGVDLTQNDAYDIAFGEMKWALDELKKLKTSKTKKTNYYIAKTKKSKTKKTVKKGAKNEKQVVRNRGDRRVREENTVKTVGRALQRKR